MATIDILELLQKARAGAAQEGSTSLSAPTTGLSAGLADALAAAKAPSSDLTEQTEQGKLTDPTIELTPSQYITAGLAAAKGVASVGNPIALLSAMNTVNDLQEGNRGKLGQWFDSLFGYATDQEVADATGSMGYVAPGSAEEEAAMQELSDAELEAKLEAKFDADAPDAFAMSEDLGFQNPDQTGWEAATLGWDTPSTPSSEDTSSSDWSWDSGGFFSDDTTDSESSTDSGNDTASSEE